MIDSHCHLDHEPLRSDLINVLKRSKENWIAQEYLNESYKEYTCGVIKLKSFCDVVILLCIKTKTV